MTSYSSIPNGGLTESQAMDKALKASMETAPPTGNLGSHAVSHHSDALDTDLQLALAISKTDAALQPLDTNLEMGILMSQLDHLALTKVEPNALPNVGASCWFNSLLQSSFREGAMYHIELHILVTQSKVPEYQERAQLLLDILKASKHGQDEGSDSITQLYKTFFDGFCNFAGFPPSTQQDPQDALRGLMSYLGLTVDNLFKSNNMPFEITEQRVPAFCVSTSTSQLAGVKNSFKEDLSNCIELSNTRIDSIQEGINLNYMAPAVLTGSDQIKFDEEGAKEDAIKIDFLTTQTEQAPTKEFPEAIFIRAPRFSSVQEATTGKLSLHKNEDDINFEERICLPIYTQNGKELESVIELELASVTVHMGDLNGGHHVAYVRNQDSDSYTRYNDSHVTQVLKSDAKKAIAKGGYLATYKKVNKNGSGTELHKLHEETLRNLTSVVADFKTSTALGTPSGGGGPAAPSPSQETTLSTNTAPLKPSSTPLEGDDSDDDWVLVNDTTSFSTNTRQSQTTLLPAAKTPPPKPPLPPVATDASPISRSLQAQTTLEESFLNDPQKVQDFVLGFNFSNTDF